jgi:peptide/nickel transport system substrate-binding protein
METTYRLQPNAFWHDGTPVTAKDIAFSAQVQLDPRVEVNPIFAGTLRSHGVVRVDTPDDRTTVIHWAKPFGFADFLTFRDFSPLPAHILQAVYERDVEEFSRHSYWSDDSVFVGNGPYHLTRWEQGVLMDLQAFDRYYLGKPKVDRMIITFVQDNNTAIARVMTGDVDMAWGANFDRVTMDQVRGRGVGDFVIGSEGVNHLAFQFKDVAQPIELARDVRLRRAMAHATDRESINQVDGEGISAVADSWVHPNDPRYRDTEPFITKYPYDTTRALALFAEAGWTRGADGLLRNAEGRAFACDIRSQMNNKSGEITASAWRTIGISAVAEPLPANLARDLEARATYRCVEESFRGFGRNGVQHLHSDQAMIPERRYVGTNRGAYMNPELDRLIDGFFATSRTADRLQLDREAVQLISTDLPILHTIYEIRKEFQRTGVTGLVIKTGLDPIRSSTWNVHEWTKQ